RSKKLAEHVADRPYQPVNPETKELVEIGWNSNGGKRESTGGGGRDAIAYDFEPHPPPKKQSKKSSAKVVDFGERKLIGMIEDESIIEMIEAWGANKSKKHRVEKAYRLVVPLIGTSRGGILALANEQDRVATAEGRAFEFKL